VVQFEIYGPKRRYKMLSMIGFKPQPEAVVTQRIDNRITEAKCSMCDEPFDLGNDVGTAKEQEMKLKAAFGRHVNAKHRSEDASQAAARIVREATENKLIRRLIAAVS